MIQPTSFFPSAPTPTRLPCVLVFAGHDPSGGAGIQADIQAISAQGAHALPLITTLTAQNNEHVFAVQPIDLSFMQQQMEVLERSFSIDAIKIGVVGSLAHAKAIALMLDRLKIISPHLPIVVDPVLASNQGDALSQEEAVHIYQPLLERATLITPNLPELARLAHFAGIVGSKSDTSTIANQVERLRQHYHADLLIKGGHDEGGHSEDTHKDAPHVCNQWWDKNGWRESWKWQRWQGEFHGSGCTLASALAAQLAHKTPLARALYAAQMYTQTCLGQAFSIAVGAHIPQRYTKTSPTLPTSPISPTASSFILSSSIYATHNL